MGDNYEWQVNPLGDLIFQILLLGYDLTDPKINDNLIDSLTLLLHSMGVKRRHITEYLDFKFKIDGDIHVRIVPANIICALWFVGALPQDYEGAVDRNHMKFEMGTYKFNKKTKRLKWIPTKE